MQEVRQGNRRMGRKVMACCYARKDFKAEVNMSIRKAAGGQVKTRKKRRGKWRRKGRGGKGENGNI